MVRRRRAASGRFQLRHGRLCARGLSCAAVRFCWDVLRLDYACLTFLLEGFVFGSRLLFDAERQTGRLAGGCVSVPAWVGIAGSTFSKTIRLSNFVSSLRDCAFLCGDPDGVPEEVQEATGKPPGGRMSLEQKPYPFAVTRNADAIRRNRIASRSCSSGEVIAYSRRYRGEYAGAARPRLRQRDIVSLDSLHVIRSVGALYAAFQFQIIQREV